MAKTEVPSKPDLMTVSQNDVARLAGVSQAAVSRTFTPGASVSDEVREQVLQAARKLGYRPNAIARSLITHSTNIIGIVVARFSNPFYMQALREFSGKLQNMGYSTLLMNIDYEQNIENVVPLALEYQVDGLIITSATLSSTMVDECVRSGTPVVLFNRYVFGMQANAVCSDNISGGRLVADALLDAGHTRPAYIAGEENSSTNRDREKGFTDRLAERGTPLFVRENGDFSYEAGYAAAIKLMTNPNPPDAIFAACDLSAMGAIDAIRGECGLRVPEDVSVIGYDDMQMAGWSGYGLTTVRQPIERMVDETINALMDAIKNPDAGTVIKTIPGVLIKRSSARLSKMPD